MKEKHTYTNDHICTPVLQSVPKFQLEKCLTNFDKIFHINFSRRLPPRSPRFDSGSLHMEFVVDKVALGQFFFPEYFGFALQIAFHRCSITRKNKQKN
jgi:hypothetical protein